MARNKFKVIGDVTVIFIQRKDGSVLESFVDTDVLPLIENYRWHAHKGKNGSFYAIANSPMVGGKRGSMILMHRLIANVPRDLTVDHADHNTLNNRRLNLRPASNSQNMQNLLGATKRSQSGVLGVFWYKNYQKWEASIRIKGKNIKLGYFDDIDMAKTAVRTARARLLPFSQEAMAEHRGTA